MDLLSGLFAILLRELLLKPVFLCCRSVHSDFMIVVFRQKGASGPGHSLALRDWDAIVSLQDELVYHAKDLQM